jgi:hypothetical protein
MILLVRSSAPQQLQRLFVLRVGTNPLVEPRNCFGVVIQHIGPRREDHVKRLFIPAEVRYQNLNTSAWIELTDPIDRLREMKRAAIGQLVSIDASDDCVFDTELFYGFANVTRFVGVQRSRSPFAHRTKAAMSSTYVAQYHEGSGPLGPALEDVWAPSFLTNSVQAQVLDQSIDAIEPFIRANPNLEPFRSGSFQFRFSHKYLAITARCTFGFFESYQTPCHQWVPGKRRSIMTNRLVSNKSGSVHTVARYPRPAFEMLVSSIWFLMKRKLSDILLDWPIHDREFIFR